MSPRPFMIADHRNAHVADGVVWDTGIVTVHERDAQIYEVHTFQGLPFVGANYRNHRIVFPDWGKLGIREGEAPITVDANLVKRLGLERE